MKKIDYSFSIDGLYHTLNYYRSESPMNINTIPTALATGIEGLSHRDTTAEANKDYFVRFGSVKNDTEKLSDEIIVSTFAPVPWANVVALLNFENGLIDATGKRVWSSSDANVAKVVETQLLWGNKALSILGTATQKYIYTNDSDDFWFSNADFGIEASLFLLSKNDFHTILSQRQDYGVQHSFCFYYFNGNFVFEYSTNGSNVVMVSAPITFATNTKYDVQCVRSGASLKIAVNGTELLSHNIGSASLFNSNQRIVVGQLNSSSSGGYFNGYIDELRVTKGYAPPIKPKLYTFPTS